MSAKTFGACISVVLAGCVCMCVHCDNHSKKRQVQEVSCIKEVSSSGELKKIFSQNSSKLVIVKAFAPWCGACTHYAPTFKKFAKEHRNDAIFCTVNIDKLSQEDRSSGILADVVRLPTTKVFGQGLLIAEKVGALSENDLEALLSTKSTAPVKDSAENIDPTESEEDITEQVEEV
ncbi:MAG: hypothetical protein UU47_C0004G0038 [candidate division TM6 bacterium GW2011_GWE2_41_16]|nr:MAG: hypothetical protein UU47_C0004G0038 [candidate division TM6 bacterium GW2011_GWE2_41_16]